MLQRAADPYRDVRCRNRPGHRQRTALGEAEIAAADSNVAQRRHGVRAILQRGPAGDPAAAGQQRCGDTAGGLGDAAGAGGQIDRSRRQSGPPVSASARTTPPTPALTGPATVSAVLSANSSEPPGAIWNAPSVLTELGPPRTNAPEGAPPDSSVAARMKPLPVSVAPAATTSTMPPEASKPPPCPIASPPPRSAMTGADTGAVTLIPAGSVSSTELAEIAPITPSGLASVKREAAASHGKGAQRVDAVAGSAQQHIAADHAGAADQQSGRERAGVLRDPAGGRGHIDHALIGSGHVRIQRDRRRPQRQRRRGDRAGHGQQVHAFHACRIDQRQRAGPVPRS